MIESDKTYSICVIDIGSPKLGNLGWCLIDAHKGIEHVGVNLDDLFPHLATILERGALILGLEAPLFVPVRTDIMLATKARKGEGRRPWSAGAGAQVLAMNLPIMVYLFRGIKRLCPKVICHLNEREFKVQKGEMMIFEALVSGSDKGSSHIQDAQIMARSCMRFAQKKMLPASILEQEENTAFFNLVAATLLHCGMLDDLSALHEYCPIYKPS